MRLLATALTGLLAPPAAAQDGAARNLILTFAGGAGVEGWLAVGYDHGPAGHPLRGQSSNRVEHTEDHAYRFFGGPEAVTQLTSEEGLNGLTFIDAVADFEALANGQDLPERVVGIARSSGTLQANREGLPVGDTISGMAFNPEVPTLATMAVGALNVLNQDEDGFFVSIEGGAVDWMGHANDMPRFIEEQMDFNMAIDAVIEWVEANSSWEETLLIVTSDHECGGIWGEGTWTNSVGGAVAADMSDDLLAEANYNPIADTFNEFLAVQDNGAGNLPGYQFASGNHTNDLVPLWAMGVGAEAFAEFTENDPFAAELWGEQYGWNGDFVHTTSVFTVMQDAMSGSSMLGQ
jgi:alkaline phosphatase